MSEPPPRPWYVRHAALLALAVLLAGQHLVARFDRRQDVSWQRNDPALVPVDPDRLSNVTFDLSSGSYEATWQPATIEWRDVGLDGTRFVHLKVKALRPCDWQSCYLQYISPDEGPGYDDTFLRERTVRPVVHAGGDEVTLQWHLLRPAERFQLLIPAGAKFTVLEHQLAGLPWEVYVRQTRQESFRLLLTGLSVALFLSWLAQHFEIVRRPLARPAILSSVILGAHGVLMLWLLPPFQGPDENRHWKAALAMYRGDAGPGSVLRELPNLLGAEAPRWKCEVPFPSQPLHGTASREVPPGEQSGVGYAGPWAYPVVGFVSLFFPTVHTLNEALLFYYGCRLVALVVLLFLVVGLWRAGLGTWTLVIFLSLPLVLQQILVVSTDTVPNLGTLAALLLFSQPRRNLTLPFLTLLVVLVVLAKPPIYAVLLLLPAWYLPRSWIWRWQVGLGLIVGVLLAIIGGYFALWSVVQRTDQTLASDAQRQLQWLLTWPGMQAFGQGLLEYPSRFLNPHYWWAPLGWLDTPLSDLHKNLLWASLLLVVAFDVGRAGRLLLRYWKEVLISFGLTVLHALFTWVSLGAVMYLTISPFQAIGIVGMQVRYMIPVVLFGLLLPVILVRRGRMAEGVTPANHTRWWWVLAHGIIVAIAAFRAAQLAGDLQYRYWG